jgi:hypothetical protein
LAPKGLALGPNCILAESCFTLLVWVYSRAWELIRSISTRGVVEGSFGLSLIESNIIVPFEF